MDTRYQHPLEVGISSCVVGEKVRFNGGHRRSAFCADTLAEYVRFVPICPEMGIGLGTPRPSVRLIKQDEQIIARNEFGENISEQINTFADQQQETLERLCGYIFCAKSPTCGMERVRVYRGEGRDFTKDGVGLYAREVMRLCPYLPVEEDGRLLDAKLRENFITRIYAYHDWRCSVAMSPSAANILAFHTRYKYLLLAHQPAAYAMLGQLLADLSTDLPAIIIAYRDAFMQALQVVATREQHTNVLQHLQGHFKRSLTSMQRQELATLIDQYRQAIVPLLAPLTLIRHYLSLYPDDYIAQQRYLHPYPDELALRYSL